jgi:hypothetical protein
MADQNRLAVWTQLADIDELVDTGNRRDRNRAIRRARSLLEPTTGPPAPSWPT